MAWNKSLPANNSKIRLAPAYIRDNWDAIETGLVPYDYLQLEKQASNPATTANTAWIFSKADPVSGYTEAFHKNSNGSVVQITSNGFVGSGTTPFYGTNYTATGYMYAATGFTLDGAYLNTQGAFITAWAFCTLSGTTLTNVANYGMTFTRTSTGLYQATFSPGRVTTANYGLIGTSFTSSGGGEAEVLCVAADQTKDTSVFSIRIKHGTSDSNSDRSFSVMVVGGR